jgi:transcription antitermination factor NusG
LLTRLIQEIVFVRHSLKQWLLHSAKPQNPMLAPTVEYPSSPTFTDICTPPPMRVLRVRPGREFYVEQNISHAGIEPFLPTYLSVDKVKRTTTIRVLFPGYLLAAVPIPENLLVLSLPFVNEFLRFGQKDAVVTPEEVERLRAASSLPGIEPWETIEQGKRVRIASGPLAGASGRLVRRKGQLRVIVAVDVLGGSYSCEVDGWCLERA